MAMAAAAWSFTFFASTALADESELRVELAWVDPTSALPDAFAHIVLEVAQIFEPVGLNVAWRTVDPGEVTTSTGLYVILLDADRGKRHGDAMGLTQRDPAATPALWLLLPNIKRALGLDPAPGRLLTPGDARLLARAVGRVVAHEVVHALAPRLRHAGHGLMSARLGRTALVAAELRLDPESARALRGAAAVDRDARAKGRRSS
jgi:hypothetical protein